MYSSWIEALEAAPPQERKRIVEEMAERYGISLATAYRRLGSAGWETGRSRRRDAGSSRQDIETIQIIAAQLKDGIRESGQSTVSVEQAREIAQANGFEITVSDSRLRTLLRDAHLDVRSLKRPAPHQRMRSLHPNHVHMVDPSLALIYYAPDGTQRQHIIRDGEAYKNKPFLQGKEHLKCWRYVLTDHYSHSLAIRYYAARGETAANLYDFLLYAWGEKSNAVYQFHGLPNLLLWDAGSANQSRAVTRALKSLRVETRTHMPGNPRVKGSVERANGIWERLLESRLKGEPVNSIEELNELAERFCAAFTANMIPNRDCRLTRGGARIGSRLSLWQHITNDQLRELPDQDACRLLLTHDPALRTVDGSLAFSFAHPRTRRALHYSLHGQPGVVVGMEVEVQPILTETEAIVLVSWDLGGERYAVEVTPIEYNEAGFDISAAVIGEEFKRPADTTADEARNALTVVAYGTADPARNATPFEHLNGGNGIVTHSHVQPDIDIAPIKRTGEQVSVTAADVVQPHEIMVSALEAIKRVKAHLPPGVELPGGFLNQVKARNPNGVPVTHIDTLVSDIVGTETYQLGKEA